MILKTKANWHIYQHSHFPAKEIRHNYFHLHHQSLEQPMGYYLTFQTYEEIVGGNVLAAFHDDLETKYSTVQVVGN